MTSKITTITAVVVAAVTVGAPSAFGEGRLAGSQELAAASEVQQSSPSRAAYERSIASGQLDLSTFGNAFDRATPVKGLESNIATYRDAFERAVATGQLDLSTFRNAFDRAGGQSFQSSVSTYRDAHERPVPVAGHAEVPTIDAGRDIEWPQIGIGFGAGIVLVLALGLALRLTRARVLAH